MVKKKPAKKEPARKFEEFTAENEADIIRLGKEKSVFSINTFQNVYDWFVKYSITQKK